MMKLPVTALIGLKIPRPQGRPGSIPGPGTSLQRQSDDSWKILESFALSDLTDVLLGCVLGLAAGFLLILAIIWIVNHTRRH